MDWPSRYQRDRQRGFSSDLVIRPALEDGLPIRRERVGEATLMRMGQSILQTSRGELPK